MKKLKGKTTVKLFDAETGELVQESSSENLVTNAVNNLLNGAWAAAIPGRNSGMQYASSFYSYFFGGITSTIAEQLFGGLMVFSTALTESVTNIIPDATAIDSYIGGGYQGATLSGSTYLGTLNTASSEVGDGYATFVWDFTQSQCNGAIACICLTSNVGGYTGLAVNDTDKAVVDNFIKSPCVSANWAKTTYAQEFEEGYPHFPRTQFTGPNEQNDYGISLDITNQKAYILYENKLYTKDLATYLSNTMNVCDTFNRGKKVTTDETNITLTNEYYRCLACTDEGIMYASTSTDAYSAQYITSGGLWDGLYVINCADGTESAVTANFRAVINDVKTSFSVSSTYNVNRAITARPTIISGGYMYQVHYNIKADGTGLIRVYKISMSDGTYTANSITDPTGYFAEMFKSTKKAWTYYYLKDTYVQINGVLYFTTGIANSAGSYSYYKLDKNTLELSESPVFRVTQADFGSWHSSSETIWEASDFVVTGLMPAPWISRGYDHAAQYRTSLLTKDIFMPYLATINNQDDVLTKDSTKTMQISYTIYEEEE